MKFKNQALFFDLLNLYGGPSAEDSIRDYFKNFCKNFSSYEIVTDRIGSVFAYKKSKNTDAKTIVIGAHFDEVCFMVTQINADGSLHIINLGSINSKILFGTNLVVITDNGTEIPGVIGTLPPHFGSDGKNDIKDIIVDLGTDTKDETSKLGVKVGDMVYFEKNAKLSANDKCIFSKSIDNRIGVGIVLSLIEQFANTELPFNLYLGCHPQEEVGLRGAKTFSSFINADLFFAVDTSPVNDINKPNAETKLGKGLLLRVYDPGNQLSTDFRHFLEEKVNKFNIPFQRYFGAGGTDAIAYLTSQTGTFSTSVVLPARYIHSQVGVCSVADIESVISFYTKFLTTSTNEEIDKLINFSIVSNN